MAGWLPGWLAGWLVGRLAVTTILVVCMLGWRKSTPTYAWFHENHISLSFYWLFAAEMGFTIYAFGLAG